MKTRSWCMAGLTLAGGLAGCALRAWLFANCKDSTGLIPRGTPAVWVLTALTVLVLAALAVLCAGADRTPTVSPRHRGAGVLLLAAGALLAVQSVLGFAGAGRLEQLVCVLGLAAAVVFVLDGVQGLTGRRGSLLADCVPAVYLALRLICNYRSWSSDPVLLDYSFSLLFAICAMLAMYQLAAFQIGRGKRRITLFWILGAIFCGLITLSGTREAVPILPALCAGAWRLLGRTEPAPDAL